MQGIPYFPLLKKGGHFPIHDFPFVGRLTHFWLVKLINYLFSKKISNSFTLESHFFFYKNFQINQKKNNKNENNWFASGGHRLP